MTRDEKWKQKLTSMTSSDLRGHIRESIAKGHAATVGHKSRAGGWIYSATGRVIAQGWGSGYYQKIRHLYF